MISDQRLAVGAIAGWPSAWAGFIFVSVTQTLPSCTFYCLILPRFHLPLITMDSGYEALPQRAGGRHGKRRRPDDANVSSAAANTDAAVTSSIASPAARAAGGAAGHSSVVIGLPDGMDDETLNTCLYEGDICGEECWEYLDHTADVLVHTCELTGGNRNAGVYAKLRFLPF